MICTQIVFLVQHLAPPPMKDENLEFKFASSHKKSVQGMIPVEAASGRRFLWSWDSNGEIRVWDTKVRLGVSCSSEQI